LFQTPPQISALYSRGIKSVIPLLRGKSPGYEGWNKLSDEECAKKIWTLGGDSGEEEEVNYGIRLGSAFGDLCDVDLDSEESRKLAEFYLPRTARFGRGGVCTHYLYTWIGRKKSASRRYQWDKRDEKSLVLEFRASGQTMGPGSVHPSTGERIEWMNDEGIREIDGDELLSGINRLAAASLLLRDWESGGRDELAVCLIGSMVRAEWGEDDIDSFLEPILLESGDEESVKRLKAGRLIKELEEGGRVPGLRRLRELCSGGGLGAAGFERIVEWLELGGGDIIEEINREYAVVSVSGGGVCIMREREGEEGGVSFMDKSSFSLAFANRQVSSGGRDVTADKFWLAHKDRREYLRGVVFRPGRDVREGEYNLWRGFSVAEVEGEFGEGWELYLGHLRKVVCGGNEEVLQWLLGWMAHRVQRPWEVPQSSVVLIGERGDGKSSVFKIFGGLFGRHYMAVTNPRHLMGNFNSHLMDKVLVLADEAIWGGDKTNEGILKVMISEDRRVIEIKGRDAFEVDNCTGYGICSNNDWVVPVGRHERRFLILRVKSDRRGDFEYWDAMYAQMGVRGGSGGSGSGGAGRMLYDLRRFDIGEWRGNRPPVTSELQEQAARGVEHWVQWALHWWSVSGGVGFWWEEDLYLEYCSWSERMRYRVETEIIWSKCMGRLFGPGMVRSRVRRVKRSFSGRAGGVTEYEKRYRLEVLDAAVVESSIRGFCGN
jgi:hypothetical protein